MNTSRFSYPSLVRACGAIVAVNLAIFSYFGCSGSEQKPPALESQAQFSIVASPARVLANGATTDLTVIARETGGASGTGMVTLKATAGSLGGGTRDLTIELASGRASTVYACDSKTDPNCVGVQKVTAEWNGKSAETSVAFYEETSGDAGVDGAKLDGGRDGATVDDGSTKPPVITLTPSKSRIFVGVDDFLDLAATYVSGGDAGAIAAADLEFQATGGLVGESTDGGSVADKYTAKTDSNGRTSVRVRDNGSAGTITVTATNAASGATKQVSIPAASAQQFQHISTTCEGTACTVMGVKDSGFNEQAQIGFRARDALGQPVPNARVTFRIVNAPSGTAISTPAAVTDAQGLATTNVASGAAIGSFVVEATMGALTAQSTPIGVRGAKPSNKSFSFRCSPVNAAVFATPTPPLSLSPACDVRIIDRFNNPVGTGAAVSFKTEAGNVPNSVNTKAYEANGTNVSEGTATMTFNTLGSLPVDVDPLEADSSQLPNARDTEPRSGSGVIANPRDGLVSVLAYLPGEEFFQDDNADGKQSPGEQFIDQGEPFVDSNDNGVWDVGEVFIDTPQARFTGNCEPVLMNGKPDLAPTNGQWDPPNGCWDANSTIWAETRILYSGRPVAAAPNSFVGPNLASAVTDLGVVPVSSNQTFDVHFRDRFFNYPEQGSTFSVTQTGNRGTVTLTGTQPDGYGFGIDRALVQAGTKQACASTAARCEWRYLFFGWQNSSAQLRVVGPTAAQTTPQLTTISPAVTVRGTKAEIPVSATWPYTGDVDGGSTSPIVTLTPSKQKFFVGVEDFADVAATLRAANGVTPITNASMRFDVTGALVVDPAQSGGTPSTSVSILTDSNGRASVRLLDNGSTGNVTLTATHVASGISRQVVLVAAAIQQLQFVATRCQGVACSVMGVRGSGFNEQAQLTFRALDTTGQPVPNARISFRAVNPPQDTIVATPSAVTDATGNVTTNVVSGSAIGSFVVEATASGVSALSTTIGVRGAKAANKGFSLRCGQVNLAAYATPTPPLPLSTNCDVRLIDRFNNPVGTGTSVNFKVEAGNVPNSINTTAYTPVGNNVNEGTGSIAFSTVGALPVDVVPLEAAPTQIPTRRDAEPRLLSGQTYNPRDSLVSLIAYLPGEEFFQDDNANGTHDANEQFIDQGEPFVDSNDNGVWDTGEIFIDSPQTQFGSGCVPVTTDGGVAVTTAPNGVWDPPNGCWDSNSTIWAETRVLYTGRPAAYPSSFVGSDPLNPITGLGNISVGSSTLYEVHFRDRYFNVPEANATYSISQTASRGTLTYTGTQLDGYGFGIDRLLMTAGANELCATTALRCEWRYHFTDWISSGYQDMRVTAPATATTPLGTVIAPAVTIRSVKTELSVSGTWP